MIRRRLLSRFAVEWRYLPTGTVRHALRDPYDTAALCGIGPADSDLWHGTGSQDEYERVDALPECRRCVALLTPAAAP